MRVKLGCLAVFLLTIGVASAKAQTKVYVTNQNDNSVSIFDTGGSTVTATVSVGTGPLGVAITPDGTRAYVTNSDVTNPPSFPGPGTVSVIDTSTNAVGAPITVGTYPLQVAITPDGNRAYVTNYYSYTVSVIDTNPSDTAYNTVVGTIPVGYLPVGIAITPDGSRAYVANQVSSTVSVIDTNSNTVIKTVTLGPSGSYGATGVAITPDGNRAYVTNFSSASVTVIDTSDNTISGSPIWVGNHPVGVAFTPDGSRAYVANQGSGTVSVIDTSTNTVVGSPIAVGSWPTWLAITSDGGRAFVTNYGSNNVSAIDTGTNTVATTVPVGAYPSGVAITPQVPFSSFSAKLNILSGPPPGFALNASLTLGSGGAIDPLTDPISLQVGSYSVTIPAGSFSQLMKGSKTGGYVYEGTIGGVSLQIQIDPTGDSSYQFKVKAQQVDLTALTDPVTVTLTIGTNTGTTQAMADFL
jgi:YVTN family beta-propeller protein